MHRLTLALVASDVVLYGAFTVVLLAWMVTGTPAEDRVASGGVSAILTFAIAGLVSRLV
jgi:hypothetical protein